MDTRLIYSKFWSDSFTETLTPIEKYLFLYFLTNDAINIIHLFECTDRKIKSETGVTQAQLDVAKEKLEEAGKVRFKGGYVLLVNADKYQKYSGESNEVAKKKLFSLLPDEIRSWNDRGVDRGVRGVYTPPRNKKQEIRNKEEDVKEKPKNLTREELRKTGMAAAVAKASEYQEYFPTLDVREEIGAAYDWLRSEGEFKRDYVAFIRNWLRRSAKAKEVRKYAKT